MISLLNQEIQLTSFSDKETVKVYFRNLPYGWQRECLFSLRLLLLKNISNLEERVSRHHLIYIRDGYVVFGLQVRRQCVSLLVPHRVNSIDPYGTLIGTAFKGRWSIHFKEQSQIDKCSLEMFLILADRALRIERQVEQIVWEQIYTLQKNENG